jgi:hypothetical protein
MRPSVTIPTLALLSFVLLSGCARYHATVPFDFVETDIEMPLKAEGTKVALMMTHDLTYGEFIWARVQHQAAEVFDDMIVVQTEEQAAGRDLVVIEKMEGKYIPPTLMMVFGGSWSLEMEGYVKKAGTEERLPIKISEKQNDDVGNTMWTWSVVQGLGTGFGVMALSIPFFPIVAMYIGGMAYGETLKEYFAIAQDSIEILSARALQRFVMEAHTLVTGAGDENASLAPAFGWRRVARN